MSRIDAAISNEMVIPRVSAGELFVAREGTPFVMGMLAVGDDIIPGREELHHGYLQLRANVYARQTRMIGEDEVRADGTESDIDDARSVHWGIFEQDAADSETARVIGSIRVIKKTDVHPRPLPIEDFFPDTFDAPVPMGGVEISRYIARHEDRRVQAQLSTPLFAAVVGHVNAHDLGPAYGVVEPPVERLLMKHGVPMQRVADPVFVPEYSADNLGFEADLRLMGQAMGMGTPEALARIRATERDFAYFDLSRSAAKAPAVA